MNAVFAIVLTGAFILSLFVLAILWAYYLKWIQEAPGAGFTIIGSGSVPARVFNPLVDQKDLFWGYIWLGINGDILATIPVTEVQEFEIEDMGIAVLDPNGKIIAGSNVEVTVKGSYTLTMDHNPSNYDPEAIIRAYVHNEDIYGQVGEIIQNIITDKFRREAAIRTFDQIKGAASSDLFGTAKDITDAIPQPYKIFDVTNITFIDPKYTASAKAIQDGNQKIILANQEAEQLRIRTEAEAAAKVATSVAEATATKNKGEAQNAIDKVRLEYIKNSGGEKAVQNGQLPQSLHTLVVSSDPTHVHVGENNN